MIYIKHALALLMAILCSSIVYAQKPELTMEVVESLDDVSEHNRISLPGQKIANVTQRSKSTQRGEVEALIASQRKYSIQTSVAKSEQQGQNSTEAVRQNTNELRDLIANYRKELANRGREIIDELKQEQAETGSATVTVDSAPIAAKK